VSDRDAALSVRQPDVDRRPESDRALESLPESLRQRVVIDALRPDVDGGRFPIKRTPGERVTIGADIFSDGHDVLAAVIQSRRVPPVDARHSDSAPASQPTKWAETAMSLVDAGTDEWSGTFEVRETGWYEYRLVAWADRFLTWRRDLQAKWTAGQDVASELLDGALLLRDAASRATDRDAATLLERADALTDDTPLDDRIALALDDRLTLLKIGRASCRERV